VIEADWPVEEPRSPAVIVAEFPSMNALKGWYVSPEYPEAFGLRAAAVKRRMIFVEGIDEPADPTCERQTRASRRVHGEPTQLVPPLRLRTRRRAGRPLTLGLPPTGPRNACQ
jgi:hypothetical protein